MVQFAHHQWCSLRQSHGPLALAAQPSRRPRAKPYTPRGTVGNSWPLRVDGRASDDAWE